MAPIELLYELPLGLVSMAMYFTARPIVALFPQKKKDSEFGSWEPLYHKLGEVTNARLLGISIVAPRWNTAASVLATTNVEAAQGTVRIRCGTCAESAERWTLIALDMYNDKTLSYLGSLTLGSQTKEWHEVLLAKETSLRLTLRYYTLKPGSSFPEVIVDGKVAVPSAPTGDVDPQWEALAKREKFQHRAIAWHVYPLLCFRDYVPAWLVRQVVLPVGNPETGFIYGPVHKGTQLCLELSAALWTNSHLVHVTIYSRGSLPTMWLDVPNAATTFTTPAFDQDGIYLIRVVVKNAPAAGPSVDLSNPTLASPTIDPDDLKVSYQAA